MQHGEPCHLLGVEPDGSVVLNLDGVRTIIRLLGITVPQPPPPLYMDILTRRITWRHSELRCRTVVASGAAGVPAVRLSYLALKDKSGDVWLDVAELLVEQGAARVAEEPGSTGAGAP